ncbi:threonine synthase [Egibacter rhizosphaerae]|uniref:Threonine synthase n=1 Tax=Egibacter rhizosphaerae TaxID=1670831 RepID=A0A411YIT7_9ACTN|nr:threonine synthase [Egibacter rhizosphaerae]QBI20992.1 threonine synthase [Egibacter rhizosphaerae]
MSFVTGLRCRECGKDAPLAAVHVCEFCFGPLEVVYDYDAIAGVTSRARIENGPRSLWRYADLLPELPDAAPGDRVDLGAGLTPLVPAPRLGAALGLSDLWIKNDTVNPSYSFKDRVVTVALSAARSLGFEVAACASTGNLANSVAAHAAHAGMDAYLFIPRDLEETKVIASSVYGPNLVAVDGTYDDVNRLCGEVAGEFPWAFVNVNVRPYYAEGSKTIGFEIAEQLGWRLPDHVVAPMASGSMLVKIDKAFSELTKVGLVDEGQWRISGAQASGCAPISATLKGEGDVIRPVKPDTIAKSLAIGTPADGYYAIDAVQRTGGSMEDVTDAEVVEGIRLLASTEGVFAETAGGVTVATLRKLVAQGAVDPAGRTVAVISGIGLKTTDAISGMARPTFEIGAGLGDFEEALSNAGRGTTPLASA